MKIRHISLYAFILFAMLGQSSFAQQRIRGHVSDINSKEALPFASVYIPELSKGTHSSQHENAIKIDLLRSPEIAASGSPTFMEALAAVPGVVYAGRQTRPSMFESESDSYFLLNAGLGTTIKVRDQLLSFSVQANNLLNEVYIDHLSTLKDLGYVNTGRNISINLSVPFGIK